MQPTCHLLHGGVNYDITAHVDEEAEVIHEVSIWHSPVMGETLLLQGPIDTFTPVHASTALQVAALERVESFYGIHPVIEAFN